MALTDVQTTQLVNGVSQAIDYFTMGDPNNKVWSKRNSDDCWYPPTCTIMTELIPKLTTTNNTYTRDTAIADAKGAVNNIFQEFKDEALVQVYQPMCIANGYNSTTMQLLVNDAYAKTVVKGATVSLENVARYAGIRVQDLQVTAQLITAIKDSIDNGSADNKEQSSGGMLGGISGIIGMIGGLF